MNWSGQRLNLKKSVSLQHSNEMQPICTKQKNILSPKRQSKNKFQELQNHQHQEHQNAREGFLQRELELKTQLQEERKETCVAMKALKATTEGREILQIQLQEQTPPTVSRKEDGRYTYAIRICAAQLVGELEAAAV